MSHNFRIFAVLIGVAAFITSGLSFAQQGYVHEVNGNVTAAVGTGQPIKAVMGQSLINNTTLTTGPKSFAVLKFVDGTVIVLKENSAFQIQNYSHSANAPEQSSALFNMLRGGLRMITGLITSKNRDALKVATPLATIGIRGTDFAAELVNPLLVQTFAGTVSLTNAAGTVLVTAGQVGSIASSTTLGTVGAAGTVPGPNMPNVSTPPATPASVPPGAAPAGAAGAAAGGAGAVAAGVAAAGLAGVAAGGGSTTTTHH